MMTVKKYSKKRYDKDVEKVIKEMHSNIYINSDKRIVYLDYYGKKVAITEEFIFKQTINVSFYYSENPEYAIDDADTGGGYYSPTGEDIELADKIITWYLWTYKKRPKNFLTYIDKPSTGYYEMADGVITNNPRIYLNSRLDRNYYEY